MHKLRNAGCGDQAIVDLLQLLQLGMVPGLVRTKALRDLWSCSQPMVSRRMAAVHALGVVDVRAGWGGYTVCDRGTVRPPAPRLRIKRDGSEAAKRWEAMRRRWHEVAA